MQLLILLECTVRFYFNAFTVACIWVTSRVSNRNFFGLGFAPLGFSSGSNRFKRVRDVKKALNVAGFSNELCCCCAFVFLCGACTKTKIYNI